MQRRSIRFLRAWFQNYLDAILFFIAEDFVGIRGFLQRKAMGDDVAWIDFALLNSLE